MVNKENRINNHLCRILHHILAIANTSENPKIMDTNQILDLRDFGSGN